MRKFSAICIIFLLLCAAACGPSNNSRYPSYKQVVAKYAPPGEYKGVKLDDPAVYPVSRYCNCPRIWYHDHWVYYYGGRWIYWDHGYWYHYPTFYIYYYDGAPYVYRRHHRSITTGPSHKVHKTRTRRTISKER